MARIRIRAQHIKGDDPAGSGNRALFDNFFSSQRPLFSLSEKVWNPPADVYETADSLVIRIEVAGVDQAEFDVVVNTSETDAARLDQGPEAFGLEEIAARPWTRVVALSARIESEIAQLDPVDAQSFMTDLGIAEPALARMIRASYDLLGRISFFTVGEDECRAWTLRRGVHARGAAGTIHTDIERGFIRAELVAYDDLIAAGAWAASRDKGTLRLEGKNYVMQDGDVVNFRFNV